MFLGELDLEPQIDATGAPIMSNSDVASKNPHIGPKSEDPSKKNRDLTPAQKEEQKAKLQEMIRAFSKIAINPGVAMDFVDIDQKTKRRVVLKMNKTLSDFNIIGEPFSSGDRHFKLAIEPSLSVSRGEAALKQSPKLEGLFDPARTVLLKSADGEYLFEFGNHEMRNEFYMSFRILLVASRSPKRHGGNGSRD